MQGLNQVLAPNKNTVHTQRLGVYSECPQLTHSTLYTMQV